MNEKALVRELRLKAGLTQADLAKQVGVSENTIANWEKGTASKWIRHLLKLCSALKCDLKDLDPDYSVQKKETQSLSPDLLSEVYRYCQAVATKDEKAASEIAAYATRYNSKLRYWIDHADLIMEQAPQGEKNEIDTEAICNALVLQSLTAQLSLFPPGEITETMFLEIVQQAKLADTFLRRYASFSAEEDNKDKYVRKLIFQTNFLAVYVIGWRLGQESTMHHHGNSLDVIYVVEGEMTHWSLSPDIWESEGMAVPFETSLHEENVPKSKGISKQAHQGDFICIPRRYAHQITNTSKANLITLHIRWGQPPDDDKWESNQKFSKECLMFEWEQKGLYQIQRP